MKVTDLTVRYADKTVLDGLTLALPDSGLTFLTGPSGRGKTTLLRVLAGLLTPDAGTVEVPSRPVMLFQEDRLFPTLDALGQVEAVLPKDRRAEAPALLDLVELPDAAHKKPGELSGGMARRLSLARCLAVEGDLLLLDEPFAGVDLERAKRILTRLKELQKPTLLTGHSPDLAALCDHTVEL